MIRTHQVDATLHIAFSGQLSLLALYDLTAVLIRAADSCKDYCLDMSEVKTISDGALAALVMFIRHARRMGRPTHLIGCHSPSCRRLAALPTLRELFEQATQSGMTSQPRRVIAAVCLQHNTATKQAPDYSHRRSELHPNSAGAALYKLTWH